MKNKIDVIIPSFKDLRILKTISALKRYEQKNDLKLFNLIVIDGGSDESYLSKVKILLEPHDLLVSEKDKGIFDALNKGLDRAESDFIWWLGSDDFINSNFPPDKFQFLFNSDFDCYSFKNCYHDLNTIIRSSTIPGYNPFYYNLGLELSHFSTIWKRDFIDSKRFDLKYKNAADYEFFKFLMRRKPKFHHEDITLSFMQIGGNSSKNIKATKKGYGEIFNINKAYNGIILGLVKTWIRILHKILTTTKYNINKRDVIDFQTSLSELSNSYL